MPTSVPPNRVVGEDGHVSDHNTINQILSELQAAVPPATTLSVGNVTTGDAGSAAQATITGTPPAQVLSLVIPRGADGAQGPQGAQGAQGPSGVVSVTAPVTNSGTSQSAVLGLADGGVSTAKLADASVTTAKIASGGLAQSALAGVGISAWAASTSYARGDLVHYLGVAYRRKSAGTSGASFNAANWDQVTADVLGDISDYLGFDTAMDIPTREGLLAAATLVSGTVWFNYFTPLRDITVSNIACATSNVASSGLTTARMAIYSISGATSQVLASELATTTNDTTLLASTQTVYTRALSTSLTLTAGTRYAAAILVIGTTMGNLVVQNVPTTVASVMSQNPRLTGAITSQTALPSSFPTTPAIGSTRPYFRLS